MKKFLLLLLWQSGVFFASAQISLTGTVINETGQPLAGASVVLENTYFGTASSGNGSFEFNHLKPGNYTLAVSFIGYEDQKVNLEVEKSTDVSIILKPFVVYTEEVTVMAYSARQNTPVTWTAVSNEKLQERNMGQDIPYLLSLTPSFVATSDAGTGIGYTAFRVRGSDMNRINITVNGIPLNDAESHATYFVDQPDLASSARNIQIQRGAGTSVNGSAAFGATVNIQTNSLNREPYAEYRAAAGSFNTYRNSLAAGTGLINNKFSFDARVSGISSDGFIDRAVSDLKSLYMAAGYHTENSVIKAIAFTGWEETYQAWNGVPSARLNNDLAGMKLYEEHGHYSKKETDEMIASDNRTYNLYTYGNQVDHYQQDNYQLHFSHRFSSALNMNMALHYTYGRGYYEQYEANQKFSDYALPNPVINGQEITRTNLVRRKWLDNDFLGSVLSLNYVKDKIDFSWGGSWNKYDGRHFGKLVWAQQLGDTDPDYEWYRGTGVKKDFNTFAKINYALTPALNFYVDVQYRFIDYVIDGTDDDLRQLDQQHRYNFLNPKAGLFYRLSPSQNLYVSYALTNREPNRDNFVDTPPGSEIPKHETMQDIELGWAFRSAGFTTGINLYRMFYHNQLALTGQINDVGAPVMINVDKSFRKGIELTWGLKLLPKVKMEGNATVSSNKILDFTEYVDDWNTWEQQSFYLGKTDLAFSPAVTGNNQLMWEPGRFSFNFISSYVGKQFIDNTSSDDRVLDAYFVNSFKAGYILPSNTFRKINLHLMVNNLFNVQYETNAWVYSYIYSEGKRFKIDGYFPQAGTNFMLGIDFSF